MKTFLLVDDDADDTGLFKEALSEVDTSVVLHSAIDGQDALNKLNGGEFNEPAVIFLDINMPVMNGWQFLTKVKSIPAYKHIPVIMFSTSPSQKDVNEALDLGALCFFTKPDDYGRLKEILRVVVTNSVHNIMEAISKFNDLKTRKVFACS